jgi:hypothetical protein
MLNRGIQLKVMVSIDERAMLQNLADVMGMSVADVVRQLVRREHETCGLVATEKPRTAKGAKTTPKKRRT